MSNVDEIKERFANLSKKRDELKAQQVQLQTKIDSANESIAEIEKQWAEQFDVHGFEEAQRKLEQMETELEQTLSKCESYLMKVGV